MPKPRFVLKEPQCKEPTLVYLLIRFDGQKLKYSTGQKILPTLWNKKKQQAKEVISFSQHVQFNAFLKKLADAAEDSYLKLLNAGERPTIEKIKEVLDEVRFKDVEVKEEKLTLLKFIEHFIQTSNKNISTIKQYKLCLNNLIEYSKDYREVDFESIDIAFYDQFVRFLMSKNYSGNTIGARIKNIKVFMI
ncbi:MAG: phage integrase SAM-like domain-containing protein, partial [Ilyomonas sp.]